MTHLKKIQLKVSYAIFVVLSKEVGRDGMVALNKRMPQLLEMRDTGKPDNEIIQGLLDEISAIQKNEETKPSSEKIFTMNWMESELIKFQKILNTFNDEEKVVS